jgi:hypothetical protein
MAALWVQLTPTGMTTFPPSGGILEYIIAAGNDDSLAAMVDVWADVTVPGMSNPYGPVLGPVQDFVFPAGYSTSRNRTLTIPGSAPAGVYALNAYLGEYNPPNHVIEAEDHFEFDKTGLGDEHGGVAEWFVDSGQPFTSAPMATEAPSESRLIGIYPNPFNPRTVISYQLSADGYVAFEVFDIGGRPAATPVEGWQAAGTQRLTFDGSELPSGIYLYRLQAGSLQASGKLVLMK